jgi:hypothetical protein
VEKVGPVAGDTLVKIITGILTDAAKKLIDL